MRKSSDDVISLTEQGGLRLGRIHGPRGVGGLIIFQSSTNIQIRYHSD